jgi:2,3-bisphosphoglycerate-dependent phosphoglycerate mutase
MSVYYLVRHAHADWTPDENRPLSLQGREESYHITNILQKYPIGAIYSSPFTRSYETILPLSKRLWIPVFIEPNLRERSMGNSPIKDFNKSVEALWRDPLFAFPNGESNYLAQQRGLGVLQRLGKEHPSGHIVVSTHGNLLALIMQYTIASIDFAFWKSMTIPDIYVLSINQKEEVSMNKLWNEK